MKGTRSLLAAFLDRSAGQWAALVLTTVGAFVVLSENAIESRWIGRSTDTGTYLSAFSYLIGGSIAAVGGYVTSSRLLTAERLVVQRSPRSIFSIALPSICADLAFIYLSLGMVYALAAFRTASITSLPWDAWPFLILGIFAATIGYGIGSLTGAIAASPYAAVIPGVLVYLLGLLASDLAISRWSSFQFLVAPYIDQNLYPHRTANDWMILVLALYSLALATFFVMMMVRVLSFRVMRIPSDWRPPALSLLVVTSLGAFLWLSYDPDMFSEPRDGQVLCDEVEPVCVWGDLDQDLAAWSRAAERARAVYGNFPIEPIAFAEYGIEMHGSQHPALLRPIAGEDELAVAMSLAYLAQVSESCTIDDATFDELHPMVQAEVIRPGTHDLTEPFERIESCNF